jgi:hypothetical protein
MTRPAQTLRNLGPLALCLGIDDRLRRACDAAEKAETARSPLEADLDRLGRPAGTAE